MVWPAIVCGKRQHLTGQVLLILLEKVTRWRFSIPRPHIYKFEPSLSGEQAFLVRGGFEGRFARADLDGWTMLDRGSYSFETALE